MKITTLLHYLTPKATTAILLDLKETIDHCESKKDVKPYKKLRKMVKKEALKHHYKEDLRL